MLKYRNSFVYIERYFYSSLDVSNTPRAGRCTLALAEPHDLCGTVPLPTLEMLEEREREGARSALLVGTYSELENSFFLFSLSLILSPGYRSNRLEEWELRRRHPPPFAFLFIYSFVSFVKPTTAHTFRIRSANHTSHLSHIAVALGGGNRERFIGRVHGVHFSEAWHRRLPSCACFALAAHGVRRRTHAQQTYCISLRWNRPQQPLNSTQA